MGHADSQASSTGSASDESRVRIILPDTVHLHISVQVTPAASSGTSEKREKPRYRSKLISFLRENGSVLKYVVPALSLVAGYFGSQINTQRTRDNLDRITTDFAYGKGDNDAAAMKLATYGNQALPAVWIALGSQNPDVRNGAVTVAKHMYMDKTVGREKLSAQMLKNYDENPTLRVGVLEWLATIASVGQLSDTDASAALAKVKNAFGSDGNKCRNQDRQLAEAAANFLSAGSFPVEKNLICGMEKNCPKDYGGVQGALSDAVDCK